jgi:serine/threonine protein kinase
MGHRGFTSRLIGTQAYMAPELLGADDDDDDEVVPTSNHKLTTKSDVYAFAMTGLEVHIKSDASSVICLTD